MKTLENPIADPRESPTSLAEARNSLLDRKYRADLALFKGVVTVYADITDLPGVVACDPDAHHLARSKKWSPAFAHYSIDVDHATRAALSPELFAIWQKLILVDPEEWLKICDRDLLGQIVKRCARLYRARSLKAQIYFKPDRHPERRQ